MTRSRVTLTLHIQFVVHATRTVDPSIVGESHLASPFSPPFELDLPWKLCEIEPLYLCQILVMTSLRYCTCSCWIWGCNARKRIVCSVRVSVDRIRRRACACLWMCSGIPDVSPMEIVWQKSTRRSDARGGW